MLIDGKSFYDVPVKNKEETHEKVGALIKITIAQLAFYWTMSIIQNIIN